MCHYCPVIASILIRYEWNVVYSLSFCSMRLFSRFLLVTFASDFVYFSTGWHLKSGTYVLHVDWAIGQFRKRLAAIVAVKGGHVEHCVQCTAWSPFTATTEADRLKICQIVRFLFAPSCLACSIMSKFGRNCSMPQLREIPRVETQEQIPHFFGGGDPLQT